MQSTNPDPDSIFVEHEGEIKEVTKALIEEIKYRWKITNESTKEFIFYNAAHHIPVSKKHVETAPSVLKWANGDKIKVEPA